jgi:hypothetical protein
VDQGITTRLERLLRADFADAVWPRVLDDRLGVSD